MTEGTRAEIVKQFEAVHAPIRALARAARRFGNLTDDLKWALWATDPDTADSRATNFNQEYADRKLEEIAPEWQAALEELREMLAATSL